MRPMSTLLFPGLLLCLIVMAIYRPPVAATPDNGLIPVYMPQVGRAEAALSEYVGLVYSQGPTYPVNTGPDSEIYLVRGDGSALTRLTDNDWRDEAAQWSPDGSFILWRQFDNNSTASVYSDLWVMNNDGSEARNLTNSPELEYYGVWSPTEARILFVSHDLKYTTGTLFLTTPSATSHTAVFEDAHFGKYEWSPTGTHFYFTVERVQGYDLYVARADGSTITLLVEGIEPYITWSPTGEWLAYSKTAEAQTDLYIVRTDGSETRQLTNTLENDLFIGWVDGGTNALSCRQGSGVYLISVETGAAVPFIPFEDDLYAYNFHISPDGRQVFYNYDRNSWGSTLYVQATNSLTRTQVSPELQCHFSTCNVNFGGWSADGRQLTYSYYRGYPPSLNYNTAFIVTLGDNNATYRQLEESAEKPVWLPHGGYVSALSGLSPANNVTIFNSRTLQLHALPLSEDGTRLVLPQWRWEP